VFVALWTGGFPHRQIGRERGPFNGPLYILDERGFDSRQGLGIFLFTTASKTALGPTQPPIQLVLGALSLGVKRLGREANHSPPSSAEVKNAWNNIFTLPIRLYGVVLGKSTGLRKIFDFSPSGISVPVRARRHGVSSSLDRKRGGVHSLTPSFSRFHSSGYSLLGGCKRHRLLRNGAKFGRVTW
jgi:hypothetical protein